MTKRSNCCSTRRKHIVSSLAAVAGGWRLPCVRVLAFLIVVLMCRSSSFGYSVLTHEEIVDLLRTDEIRPLLLQRYPQMSKDQIKEAHAYTYGGAVRIRHGAGGEESLCVAAVPRFHRVQSVQTPSGAGLSRRVRSGVEGRAAARGSCGRRLSLLSQPAGIPEMTRAVNPLALHAENRSV